MLTPWPVLCLKPATPNPEIGGLMSSATGAGETSAAGPAELEEIQ